MNEFEWAYDIEPVIRADLLESGKYYYIPNHELWLFENETKGMLPWMIKYDVMIINIISIKKKPHIFSSSNELFDDLLEYNLDGTTHRNVSRGANIFKYGKFIPV